MPLRPSNLTSERFLGSSAIKYMGASLKTLREAFMSELTKWSNHENNNSRTV